MPTPTRPIPSLSISGPRIQEDGEHVVVVFEISSESLPGTLWFKIDRQFSDPLSPNLDCALTALIVPAMRHGRDIVLNGPVSRRLWQALSGPFQFLFHSVAGLEKGVRIHAEEFADVGRRPWGVATGFSGGVDSFTVLADYYFANDPTRPKVTHLLFNNVGSHGTDRHWLFEERFATMHPVAEKIGLPLIAVDSNMYEFYDNTIGFMQTDSPRNGAVAHLLQGGVGDFLYASSYSLNGIHTRRSGAAGHSDPLTMLMLGTESMHLQTVGLEYDRVQKTLRIAELELPKSTLNVCVGGTSATNCSKCWKCMRTQLTLDAAGLLQDFSEVFDEHIFREHLPKYLVEALLSTEPNEHELVQFLRHNSYRIPAKSRLYAWLDKPATIAFKWRERLFGRI